MSSGTTNISTSHLAEVKCSNHVIHYFQLLQLLSCCHYCDTTAAFNLLIKPLASRYPLPLLGRKGANKVGYFSFHACSLTMITHLYCWGIFLCNYLTNNVAPVRFTPLTEHRRDRELNLAPRSSSRQDLPWTVIYAKLL